MTLLTRNTTPAERARGCIFSELFRDAESVARNGGTPIGSPAIDKGVTLDGSTRYVTYDAADSFFASGAISLVCEFYPDFDYDDDVQYTLCDGSPASTRVLAFKRPNASSNTFGFYMGSTSIGSVNTAVYGPYWRVGQKNVLVLSGVSGDTNVWLNGALILASAVAWSGGYQDTLYIGSNNWQGSFFDGRITKFQIYDRLLTADEVDDVYSYRNETSLHLPFGAAQHDPANVRTLDVSGNDRHATFGDGVTPTTYSTKSAERHGYDFDGGDYMTVVGTGVFNAAAVTIAVEFTPDFAADFGSNNFLYDAGSTPRYYVFRYNTDLQVSIGGTTAGNVLYATYAPYWFKGRRNVLVVSGVSGDTSVWLNGVLISANNAIAWSPGDPDTLAIGSRYTGSAPFDGRIHSFWVWRQALTPLQVADLTIRAGIQANDI